MAFLQSSYVRAAIAALLISTAFFGAMLLGMFLIAKLPEMNGTLKSALALAVLVIVFVAVFEG